MRSLTRKEIQTIFATARRALKHPGCDFLLAPRSGPEARLLVVTSRKIGNSPERNKVRRRLKAIFYENQLYNQPFDCIIIVKKPGIEIDFDTWKLLVLQTIQSYIQKYS
ncbi:MAG TPA: ribonuclease P protein component [Candidatus Babeliales bacterium]|nr:ribonuclease P protein component [Candidatus Babeliales bacterium]